MDFAFLLTIFLLPFSFAFLTTILATPLVIKFANRAGLIDDPKKRSHPGVIHTNPIPRAGGLALFLGAFLPAFFLLPKNITTLALFAAALLTLLIGLLDDKYNANSKDVSPYIRFVINILCAVIVVAGGVDIPFVTNPFGGILHLNQIFIPFLFFSIPLSKIIAVGWIIWIMNALNWSKGVDGQMPGIVAISAITIGIITFRFAFSDPLAIADAKLAFIIAGACVGFLFYNFYPAKIFPGYGATSIYLLLAAVSILSSAKLATALLVMSIPAVDSGFTIVRRILARKSPFKGDNRHLHHMLLRLGYNQRQITLFYWLISALLGGAALFLDSKSKVFAMIMVCVVAGGALLFLHLVVKYTHENKTS